MLVDKNQVDLLISQEKARQEFGKHQGRSELDFRNKADRDHALTSIRAALREPSLRPDFAFGVAEEFGKGAPQHLPENQALLDLSHRAILMARAMPDLSPEEGAHLDRAAELLRAGGADPAATKEGSPGGEAREGGHEALSGAALALIERVKGNGNHAKETLSHLEEAQAHLRAAGAEEEDRDASLHPAKSASGGNEFPPLRKFRGM